LSMPSLLVACSSKPRKKAGHGNWLPWLAEHCPNISERHAQNFMAMARNRAEIEAKSATVADLTIREALALAKPEVEDECEVKSAIVADLTEVEDEPEPRPAVTTTESQIAARLDAEPSLSANAALHEPKSTQKAKAKANRRSTAAKGGKKNTLQAAEKRSPEEKHTRDLIGLFKAWNPVNEKWGEACLSAQREFLQRVAEDTNATIHFANEEYKPSPVDKYKAAREPSEARPDVLN
jgi:hypothetical protein